MPTMPNPPKPPNRVLALAAAATGILAALLCTGAFITFGLRWDSRMSPAEIRLALIALAVATVRHALWSFHSRQRGLYEQAVEAAKYDRRLTELERLVGCLDRTVCDVNGRTKRLAKILQEDAVVERPGEDTGELISVARQRGSRLRSVPRDPQSNLA